MINLTVWKTGSNADKDEDMANDRLHNLISALKHRARGAIVDEGYGLKNKNNL